MYVDDCLKLLPGHTHQTECSIWTIIVLGIRAVTGGVLGV